MQTGNTSSMPRKKHQVDANKVSKEDIFFRINYAIRATCMLSFHEKNVWKCESPE